MEKCPEMKSGDVSAFPDPHLKHIFFTVVKGRLTEETHCFRNALQMKGGTEFVCRSLAVLELACCVNCN